MKKIFSVLSVFALLLTACGAPEEADPIKIGYIGPLTGDASTYGSDTLHGAEIKVAEINAAGGVNGRPIQLIVEDARCTGTDAVGAAQKLIHVDKVIAINGGQCSGESLAAAPISNAASIPQISPGSSSPDITDAGDFIFRIIPSDALAAGATAKHLKAEGLLKVAIITENTDFATAFGASLKESMGQDAIVFEEIVEPNTKDFRTLMARLQDTEFDVFVANGQSVAIAAAMLTQLREQGMNQPTIGNNAVVSPTLSETAGEAAEGLKVVMPPSEGANKTEFDTFAATFTQKYGVAESSIIYAAFSYDTIGILAAAIQSIGTDGPAIRDYLYNLDQYVGASGTFSFDANGDIQGIPFEIQQVQNGTFVKIADIAVE